MIKEEVTFATELINLVLVYGKGRIILMQLLLQLISLLISGWPNSGHSAVATVNIIVKICEC